MLDGVWREAEVALQGRTPKKLVEQTHVCMYDMPIRGAALGGRILHVEKERACKFTMHNTATSTHTHAQILCRRKERKKGERTRHASSSFSLLKPRPRRSSARTQALASFVLTPRPRAACRSATNRGTCQQVGGGGGLGGTALAVHQNDKPRKRHNIQVSSQALGGGGEGI